MGFGEYSRIGELRGAVGSVKIVHHMILTKQRKEGACGTTSGFWRIKEFASAKGRFLTT
jgi:hypothetical protein